MGKVVHDPSLKMELWNEGGEKLNQWLPPGKNLEELTLVELETQWGEYWDSTGITKSLQYGAEALKAVLTGSRMDGSKASDHAKLSLSSDAITTGISAQ